MFDTFIVDPMINALLMFYDLLGNNYVLAIAVFTIVIRLITLPLNIRQQKSMQKTQEMQPQIQAIQKKYKDNPQRMQEEFKKIGYNPTESLTGCLPLLIQMPILFGLYRAIIVTLGSTPQSLFELTQRAYNFIDLTPLLPVANKFLWLNLGQPDPYFILPVLVFATMWAQQKILTPQTPKDPKKKGKDDNPAAAMSKSMQTTMPLMFGFFSLSFPSGLSIYFVLANIIGIGQGYYTRYITKKEKEETKQNKSSLPPPSSADQAVAEGIGSRVFGDCREFFRIHRVNHRSHRKRIQDRSVNANLPEDRKRASTIMKQEIEAKGPSVEEAIASGLSKLSVKRDDVDVEILDEGRRAILGIGGRDAVVRLTVLTSPETAPQSEQKTKPIKEEAKSIPTSPSLPRVSKNHQSFPKKIRKPRLLLTLKSHRKYRLLMR